MSYSSRLALLRKRMAADKISTMFITELADIKWLSGYTGTTAYVAITEKSAVFTTDGRYETQCKQCLDGFWELDIVSSYPAFLKATGEKYASITIQPSAPALIYSYFKDAGAEVSVDSADLMQELRAVKEDDEIVMLKEEYLRAGKAFLEAVAGWRFGQTEVEWAALLEYNMRKLGAVGPSFETIVASGARAALPHGTASDKIIMPDEPVTVDFGSAGIYNSDYTRVIYNGDDKDIIHIIDTVREALESALDAVKPGVKASDVDAVARRYIDKAGYGKYFNHGLGHGVGMQVHELPHVSPRGDMIISENMVFTIEPGVYLPGKYGARLEQTVAVNSSGCELISNMLNKYVYRL